MLRPDKILYEAEVTATGGRDGKAASDDGLLSVSLSLPRTTPNMSTEPTAQSPT